MVFRRRQRACRPTLTSQSTSRKHYRKLIKIAAIQGNRESNGSIVLRIPAYNLTRVMNIIGTRALLAAIRA